MARWSWWGAVFGLISAGCASPPVITRGTVAPGFEEVHAEFDWNLYQRGENGAALAVYHRGEKVVDLWGGARDNAHNPWEESTLVPIYSTTKGVSALMLAIAHARGWLEYDAKVAAYWPEFAQNGKQDVTVRQLLSHQAGLVLLDQPLPRELLQDLDALAIVLARQKPRWEPGKRHGYHLSTLGFYQG